MSGKSHFPFLCLCLICVSVCVCVVQLNVLHSELANQMADSMVFPLIQFREKDLTGIKEKCVEHSNRLSLSLQHHGHAKQ